MRRDLERLAREPEYYCFGADVDYGLARAAELGDDPFKVAVALSQAMDDRETPADKWHALRAWLIAEFMRRRQLQLITERQELTAFREIFGYAPRWRFGGGCYGLFDHTFYFRFRDRTKGYLLTTHPYNPDQNKWGDFGNEHGADIEFVDDFPSWWAPFLGVERGRRWPSVLIVCTRRRAEAIETAA